MTGPCAYGFWTLLPRDQRRRLRGLFSYMGRSERLNHLYDSPRCASCRAFNREAA